MQNIAPFVWKDGKMIEWDQAQDNNFTHTMHYGSGVFEGIRFYDTDTGPKIFRLDAHIDRLMYSAKVFEMNVPYSAEDIKNACLEVVKRGELSSGYIRLASIADRAGERFEFSSCEEGTLSNEMKKIYLDVVQGKDKDYLHYLS